MADTFISCLLWLAVVDGGLECPNLRELDDRNALTRERQTRRLDMARSACVLNVNTLKANAIFGDVEVGELRTDASASVNHTEAVRRSCGRPTQLSI